MEQRVVLSSALLARPRRTRPGSMASCKAVETGSALLQYFVLVTHTLLLKSITLPEFMVCLAHSALQFTFRFTCHQRVAPRHRFWFSTLRRGLRVELLVDPALLLQELHRRVVRRQHVFLLASFPSDPQLLVHLRSDQVHEHLFAEPNGQQVLLLQRLHVLGADVDHLPHVGRALLADPRQVEQVVDVLVYDYALVLVLLFQEQPGGIVVVIVDNFLIDDPLRLVDQTAP
uniref:(northern house mosquito) hypothetical protein n=1 Tax=Culex pipiens TaxID=7175 RepID=A0A8D8FNQ4_CULPI